MQFQRWDHRAFGKFALREFACKCNMCTEQLVSEELIEKLNLLRDLIGKPIRILSGFRCERHNQIVGGQPDSTHLKGLAADIMVDGMSGAELCSMASGYFKRIGTGPTWCHVDVAQGEARWAYVSAEPRSLTAR